MKNSKCLNKSDLKSNDTVSYKGHKYRVGNIYQDDLELYAGQVFIRVVKISDVYSVAGSRCQE